MKIIPVLDLLGGQVVRGVGGKRDEYRPVVSKITRSPTPLDVALAFREHFGLSHLYVADLDAIGGKPPVLSTCHELKENGFALWVDAGIRTVADADPLAGFGIIAGLESLTGPDVLRQLVQHWGAEQFIFSLDMKDGKPLCRAQEWGTTQPNEIADIAIDLGIQKMIVLDLANVGMNEGTSTQDLCTTLIECHPHVEIITGGGSRGREDLMRLHSCGLHGVLVASALHDGRITRDDIVSVLSVSSC